MTKSELIIAIEKYRKGDSSVARDFFQKLQLKDEDLSYVDLSDIDFSWSDFNNVNFIGCKLNSSILNNSRFRNCDLSKASFVKASLFGVDFRGCNLSFTNCDGTDFTGSILLDANLEGLIHTESTIHFRNHCPQEGYIFGYKKCFNDRMVKLLIPADARRCSSTTNACRCDKAKVVEITNLDKTISYKEATSFVDGNFIYKLGEMMYADSYNENRWLDSSHGIHFWMTFEEALGYM